jgi:DNA-binding XRE family transcriptional regulator
MLLNRKGCRKMSSTSILIKRQRKYLGITQAKLAQLVGYDSAQAIYMIETGRIPLPRQKAKRFARAMLLDRFKLATAMIEDYTIKIEKLLNIEVR